MSKMHVETAVRFLFKMYMLWSCTLQKNLAKAQFNDYESPQSNRAYEEEMLFTHFGVTLRECLELCTDDPGCGAVSYKDEDLKCEMIKSSGACETLEEVNGYVSYQSKDIDCDIRDEFEPARENRKSYSPEMRREEDLTLEECLEECKSESDCDAVNYNPRSDTCGLIHEDDACRAQRYVSGYDYYLEKDRACANTKDFENRKTDMRFSDRLQDTEDDLTLQECLDKCSDDDDCGAVNYRRSSEACELIRDDDACRIPSSREGYDYFRKKDEACDFTDDFQNVETHKRYALNIMKTEEVISHQECLELCLIEDDCGAVNYDSSLSDKLCELIDKDYICESPITDAGTDYFRLDGKCEILNEYESQRTGRKFDDGIIDTNIGPTLEECLEDCFSSSRCNAVNYRGDQDRCELIRNSDSCKNPQPKNNYISFRVKDITCGSEPPPDGSNGDDTTTTSTSTTSTTTQSGDTASTITSSTVSTTTFTGSTTTFTGSTTTFTGSTATTESSSSTTPALSPVSNADVMRVIDFRAFWPVNQKELEIPGDDFESYGTADQYKVYIGNTTCADIIITDDLLTCTPENRKPDVHPEYGSELPVVRIIIGDNEPVLVAQFDYQDSIWDNKAGRYSLIAVIVVILVLIIGIILVCFCFTPCNMCCGERNRDHIRDEESVSNPDSENIYNSGQSYGRASNASYHSARIDF